jgi:hypothetical protein
MITNGVEQKPSTMAMLELADRIHTHPAGSTWVVPSGFSVWKPQYNRKVVQVVGDNSEVNGRLKRIFMELGWSVVERELL